LFNRSSLEGGRCAHRSGLSCLHHFATVTSHPVCILLASFALTRPRCRCSVGCTGLSCMHPSRSLAHASTFSRLKKSYPLSQSCRASSRCQCLLENWWKRCSPRTSAGGKSPSKGHNRRPTIEIHVRGGFTLWVCNLGPLPGGTSSPQLKSLLFKVSWFQTWG